MDVALRLCLTKIQLNRVNAVCKFLGVYYVSELSLDGRYLIFPRSLEDMNKLYRVTRGKPKQKEPNQRSWDLFYIVLHEVTDSRGRLRQQLGAWTKDHSSNGCWKTYKQGTNMYEDMNDSWDVYETVDNELRCRDTVDDHEFDYKSASPIEV